MNGKGTFATKGKSYSLSKGQAFIIKPYAAHRITADEEDPWEYVWLGFECDITLPKIIAENDVFNGEEFFDIIENWVEIHKSSKNQSSQYAASIYALFARMYELELDKSHIVLSISERAMQIIDAEYATITINGLASKLFLNRSYLGAVFKKETGKSPKEYLDSVRLENASLLISKLGYTATAAALSVGYSDVSSFSRMYKRHYGVSPSSLVKGENKKRETVFLK